MTSDDNDPNMPIRDVLDELNRVKAQGLIADFAIGGAVAAAAYIEAADTEDFDVFIVVAGREAASLAPLSSLWPNLIAHGAKQIEGPYLEIGGWPVQFLATGRPLYDEALTHAVTREIDGQTYRIVSPTYLSVLALDAGRPKDYARIAEFLRTGKVIREELEALVEKFGLTDRWETFRSRWLNE